VPDLLSRCDGTGSKPAEKSIQPRYLYHITAAFRSLPLLHQGPTQDWPLHCLCSQNKCPAKAKERPSEILLYNGNSN
jgi:hypothetical protein